MKPFFKPFLIAAALAFAVTGLSGCLDDDDDSTAQTPPPPSTPQNTDFTQFVHQQFSSDLRDSETAVPVDVNSLTFEMNDLDNPDAYDDLLPQDDANTGG